MTDYNYFGFRMPAEVKKGGSTDGGGLAEIDEGVAKVAFVLEVNWQVEKVVGPGVSCVDEIEEVALCVLVWDVFDHDGGALVLTLLDPRHV